MHRRIVLLCACFLAACKAEKLHATRPAKRPARSKPIVSGSPPVLDITGTLPSERALVVPSGAELVASVSPSRGSTAAGKEVDNAGRPSFYWAVLHNWLYFLALGLSIPVLPRVISTIVNADGSPDVSPASSVLSGDVEALDKVITFLCVGFLGAASDVLGRKALMAYSALGFAITCFLQASAKSTTALLYVADLVDGCTSCMATVCQAYVADASPPEKCAGNLGIFQGLSVAGAFILGFPISAALSAKYGLRAPLYAASAVGVVNFLIALFVTPESLPKAQRAGKKIDLSAANPFGALRLLFGSTGLLRGASTTFALLWLGNTAINALFGNYVNHLFGWGPQEAGPLLVLVGIMLAIAPKVLVPRLGLRNSMQAGAAIYAVGLLATAFAKTPGALISSVLFTSIGCICVPALIAFISAQAAPSERGALLGGVETLQELCEAIAHPSYGRLFATFIGDSPPIAGMPGAPFVAASSLMVSALLVIRQTLGKFAAAAAPFLA